MGAISHLNAHFPPGACNGSPCVSAASTLNLATSAEGVQRILFLRRIESLQRQKELYRPDREDLSLKLIRAIEQGAKFPDERGNIALLAHLRYTKSFACTANEGELLITRFVVLFH